MHYALNIVFRYESRSWRCESNLQWCPPVLVLLINVHVALQCLLYFYQISNRSCSAQPIYSCVLGHYILTKEVEYL